jgi:hypothetical protein
MAAQRREQYPGSQHGRLGESDSDGARASQPATPATLVRMSTSNVRQPVRLGIHDGKPVFEQAAGLHDAVMGLSVVGGFTSGDPEVIFEEHGTGQRCDYFALHPDAILDESVGPRISRPDLRARLHDED